MIANSKEKKKTLKPTEELRAVTIRFCGDSGDGMQLAGTQFTNTSAIFGNDISTFPDFPAEIRAPAGTLAGVSGYQIRFSADEIYTPGDLVDVLIAMNPAALKANLVDLSTAGVLIVNEDEFTASNLKKAGYEQNPLDGDQLSAYKLQKVKISTMNKEALKDSALTAKGVERCKNFFALGLVYWLYGRAMTPTLEWINEKFGKNPDVADANTLALKTGYYYGETTEEFAVQFVVPEAKIKPGRYRKIMGNEATALGMIVASKLAEKELFLGSYPITPASTILEELNRYKNYGVKTFQAEDEIAAVTSIIGASFAGSLSLTTTSGPGLALKGEALGLGVIMELPMVIVDVQRGGPSTGLPTKTEQSDLNIALYGRHGECPIPVIAARSPGDCFYAAIEASRYALEFMTPVLLLTDGYIANGSEPWSIPNFEDLDKIHSEYTTQMNQGDEYLPYLRDENGVRPWAIPGTPGLEHRLGGLEKADGTGDVCYDPKNHHHMTQVRDKKVQSIAKRYAQTEILGEEQGQLLVIGWGGTYGSIMTAVHSCREQGLKVSFLHLRNLNPLPNDLGSILNRFDQILIPELNLGQLRNYLQGNYRREIIGLNKVEGKPFLVNEISAKISEILKEKVRT